MKDKYYSLMKKALSDIHKEMEDSNFTEPVHTYNYECLVALLYLSLHELKSTSDKYYVRMPEYLNNELIDFWIDNDIPSIMPISCQVKSSDYLSPELLKTYGEKAYATCPDHQLVIIGKRKDDKNYKGIKLEDVDKMLNDLARLMVLRNSNYLIDFTVASIESIINTDQKRYQVNMDNLMLEKKRKSCEYRNSFVVSDIFLLLKK